MVDIGKIALIFKLMKARKALLAKLVTQGVMDPLLLKHVRRGEKRCSGRGGVTLSDASSSIYSPPTTETPPEKIPGAAEIKTAGENTQKQVKQVEELRKQDEEIFLPGSGIEWVI